MSEIKDRVKKRVAIIIFEHEQKRVIKKFGVKKLKDWDRLSVEIKNTWLELIEEILSISELAIVDREAKPHKYTSLLLSNDYIEGTQHAQQDMLKAGWVKEVKA